MAKLVGWLRSSGPLGTLAANILVFLYYQLGHGHEHRDRLSSCALG